MVVNAGIFKKIFLLVKDKGFYAPDKVKELEVQLESSDDMMSVFIAYEIFNPVVECEDWVNIGNDLGSKMIPLDLGVLGYYLHACENLFMAYEKLVRYQALLSDVANFHIEKKRNEMHWYLITPMAYGFMDDRMMKVVSDFSMAYRHKTLESLIGREIVPQHVEYVYPDSDPAWVKQQEKFFGCA